MNRNNLYERCSLCPRKCGVNRYETAGFCALSAKPKIAKTMLHKWEEPCISVGLGSGAVFFSGCTLRCCFCQNHEISQGGSGREISERELADIFLSLQKQGAENINLVSATPFVPSVTEALEMVKSELKIPVVYNCGGYESIETLKILDGYVDVYLPDVKYFADEYALEYSGCKNYFETALTAVKEMHRQTGNPKYDESGKMLKGVIVRHLVIPTLRRDSMNIIRTWRDNFEPSEIVLSLMSQYLPMHKVTTDERYRKINRRVSSFEYESVRQLAEDLGFEGYSQDRSSSNEVFVPEFSAESD